MYSNQADFSFDFCLFLFFSLFLISPKRLLEIITQLQWQQYHWHVRCFSSNSQFLDKLFRCFGWKLDPKYLSNWSFWPWTDFFRKAVPRKLKQLSVEAFQILWARKWLQLVLEGKTVKLEIYSFSAPRSCKKWRCNTAICKRI